MAKKKRELSKSALNAIGALDKRFGESVIMKMGSSNTNTSTIPTGREDLNSALGGGFGKGKIIEVFGESGTGKTGICLDAAAACQKSGGIVAFIDFENALNTEYCEQTGVNIDDLYISQPSYSEQGFMAIRTLINTGEVDLIIVDSVASMIPRAELEGETGQANMGVAARTMGQGLRQIVGPASENGCTVIFINQLRKSLSQYGNPNVTPGGKALPFAATQRLEVKNKGRISVGEEVVGFKQNIKVIKNKVAPPFKEVDYEMFYGKGVDLLGGFIDALVFEEIVEKLAGGVYKYQGVKLARGLKVLRETLEDNPELMEELQTKLDGKRV